MSAAAMLVLAAFADGDAAPARGQRKAAIAFGLFIAFGELLRLALPGGREAAPIAMAGAHGLRAAARRPKAASHGARRYLALQVIAVAAIGMTLGALPHIAAAGRPG